MFHSSDPLRARFSRIIALAGIAVLVPVIAGCAGSINTAGASSSLTSTTDAGTSPSAAAPSSGSPTADAQVRTVQSAYGDIVVPVQPERIAAVSYNTPWQLMALDVTPVAVQDFSRWSSSFTSAQQEFVAGIPTIGGYGELNIEALAATAPDLIVGEADEIDQATFTQLSRIAPTVLITGVRGDWEALTETLADLVNRTAEWEATRGSYRQTLDRLKQQYADVIAEHTWIHFSIGNIEGEFSVQQPTGAIGHLVVDELGLTYGPGVPTDWDDAGYASYSVEQLGTVSADVTVALYPAEVDGTNSAGMQAILDNPLFVTLPVATSGKTFGIPVTVTDYVTANNWLEAVETDVFARL